MSLQANVEDLYFATQFSVDKIVGILQGTYTSGTDTTTLAGYLYQYAIPHSFTRPVFCELLISTDGINYQDGGASGGSLAAIAYSDASFIYVTTGQPTGTLYYKVICSWIDNYDTTNPSITPILQNLSSNSFFDSRQNYQKIFLQDMGSASSLGADNLISVNHGLGYRPNAKVFFESVSGQVWPQIDGGTNDFWLYAPATQAECYAVTNSTALNIDVFIPAGGSTTRAWYRIYLDK